MVHRKGEKIKRWSDSEVIGHSVGLTSFHLRATLCSNLLSFSFFFLQLINDVMLEMSRNNVYSSNS